MSELTAYHCNEWHNEYTEFYIKSEADKVIAELESENESLLQQNRELCQALQAMYSKEEYDKQKFKRCLAMAKWCDTKGDWYYSLGESFRNRVDFFIKWRDKWLKIADKFKEAK